MRLKVEVFRTAGGVTTVTTDRGDGGGTRLCGVKLFGSGSRKVAEFFLDRNALEALAEDFEAMAAKHGDACNCEQCR